MNGWSPRFDDSIPLPNGGKQLITLRDAATFITKLPKREHDAPEWRTAIEVLMLVAEYGGDTMMPRIAILRALNAGDDDMTRPRRKRAKKYKIV